MPAISTLLKLWLSSSTHLPQPARVRLRQVVGLDREDLRELEVEPAEALQQLVHHQRAALVLLATQRDISVTQRALSVTQRALRVTQRALRATQRALRATQRALLVSPTMACEKASRPRSLRSASRSFSSPLPCAPLAPSFRFFA